MDWTDALEKGEEAKHQFLTSNCPATQGKFTRPQSELLYSTGGTPVF